MPARGAGGLKVMHHGGAGRGELGCAPRGGVFLSRRAKKPARRARVRARKPARRAGVRRVAHRTGQVGRCWPGGPMPTRGVDDGQAGRCRPGGPMPARWAGVLKVTHHGGAGRGGLGYAPRGGVFLSKRAKKPARRAGVRKMAHRGGTGPRWPGYALKMDAFSSGGHPEGRGPQCRKQPKSCGHQAKSRVLKPRKVKPEAIEGRRTSF